jgi:SAM-dependent methyltransferase
MRVLPPAAYRGVRSLWRGARLAVPSSWLSRRYPGVPGAIHDEDYMLVDASPASVEHYVRVGQEPLERMGEALAVMGLEWTSVRTFLDYGSGYGRVLRWLAERHPAIALAAADVNRQAVSFCAREFGARPIVAPLCVRKLCIPGTYDLVWVGSVLTHLPEKDGVELLERLAQRLSARGVLVFSTLGELIHERLPEYGTVAVKAEDEIRLALERGRVCFLEEGEGFYPITFHPRETLASLLRRAEPPLELIRHFRRGWDDHQDVWAFRLS